MTRSKGDSTVTARERGPVPSDAELTIGMRIGRYEIEERLGAGGMGVVYAAWDTVLARNVALKVLRPRATVDATQARLRREAKAMARLSHRNVVPVFDIASHDGQLFIAMELVEGDPLRAWVIRPRPWREVVRLFVKAGDGLAAAHAAGLAHRDFKPDNVIVGDGDEPRITDFGLARELGDEITAPPLHGSERSPGLAELTVTGSLAGTPAYMAPEQLLDRESGPAADQFSFCVSLFEVLYGVRPFTNQREPDAIIAEVRAGQMVRPPSTRGVPGRLHAAIVRGLAFDPAERWPSMRALLAAIERASRRRPRWLVGALAIAVIAVVAGRTVGDRTEGPSCADAEARGIDAITLVACKDEYVRTGDPAAGARLAEALRRTRNIKDAEVVANELLTTAARADALYTLGRIAADEDRRADAQRALRLASELHGSEGRWGEAAADLFALAKVAGDIVDQLVVLDQAVSSAQRGGRRKPEAASHLAAASLLSRIGARAAALEELARAAPLVAEADRLQLELERGNVFQNLDEHAEAITAFQRAVSTAAPSTRLALSTRLNLAYSLAAAGRTIDAAAQAHEAARLDPGDRRLSDRLGVDAWIAWRAGDLAQAAELAERALAATAADATADLIELESLRAEIALVRGDLAAAEQWARRAIARIEAQPERRRQPPAAVRSWLVTDRRAVHEVLFASLARRGDAAGALIVFDRYRGPAALAALVHGDGHAALSGVAYPAAEFARLVPALASSRLSAPVGDAAVLAAVASGSLLALVVARGELWRIAGESGRLDVTQLGALPALRPVLDAFRARPGDRSAAAAAGALLVPAALARPAPEGDRRITALARPSARTHPLDRTLHVVVDEALAWLPAAALEVAGQRLAAVRPIVRAVRPSDIACAPPPASPRRLVAISPEGVPAKLPAGTTVTALPATRASLFGVARGELLHLAVARTRGPLGDAVALDGEVTALEIAGRSTAAQVVVTADGDRASDRDVHGSVQLAIALVAAGADQVIATVRPVSGDASDRLVDQLYRSEGGDLVRVLARLQATSSDDDWLGFAAFGRTLCTPTP